ncbi:MAG: hypothetical protein U0W40_04040 [Acidimicrobiia bacterium]
MSEPADTVDPVILKRRRIRHWVGLAKRVGYTLLLVAIVGFFVALFTGFPGWIVTVIVVALVGACIILPVPIVLGYGLRAADREDREAMARRAATGSEGGTAGGTPPATGQ